VNLEKFLAPYNPPRTHLVDCVRYWTDIVVREMVMLGQGGASGPGSAPAPRERQTAGRTSAPQPFDGEDDDLPF
jgi:hypothetical protein